MDFARKGISIESPFELPTDWKARLRRIANSFGAGIDRADEHRRGVSSVVVVPEEKSELLDEIAEQIEHAFVGELRQHLFGGDMALRKRVSVLLDSRPPDRYESLVHAAAARNNCSAARVFATHNGVDFDVFSLSDNEQNFLQQVETVRTSAVGMLSLEAKQQPAGSVTYVTVNESQLSGSPIVVGHQNRVTSTSGQHSEEVAEILENLRRGIEAATASSGEKEDASFALERVVRAENLEQAARWLKVIKEIGAVSSSIAPAIFDKLLQLLHG